MASRVNSEYAYITMVNGLTPWERLKTIRSFIEDRTIASKIKETISVKQDAAQAELEAWEYEMNRDDISVKDKLLAKSKYLEAKAKKMETDAFEAQQKDGCEKLDEELAFLIAYEAELVAICESSRIPGKTDSEMYEINKPLEDLMRHTKAAEIDILSKMLNLSRDVVENGIKNPLFYNKLKNTHQAMQLPRPQKIQTSDTPDIVANKLEVLRMYVSADAPMSNDALFEAAEQGFINKQQTLIANGIQLDNIPDTIGDFMFKNINTGLIRHDEPNAAKMLSIGGN